SNKLCVTRSDDGVAFRTPARCYDHVSMWGAPAMAVFNDRLHVAVNAGPQLAVTSSADGVTFDPPRVHGGIALGDNPAMAVFKARLYLHVTLPVSSNTLYVTRSDDGVAFRTPARQHPDLRLLDSPAMAAF